MPHIDYEFLSGALTVIGNGGLTQVGRSLAEEGFKAVKVHADKIWGFIKDRSQPEAIAELKTNPSIQVMVAELAKLIEADPELKAALKQAIALGRNQQVGLEDITAGNQFKANIDQNAEGDGIEQVGARRVNAGDGATFVIKQTINKRA
jgi:hypothetical protein